MAYGKKSPGKSSDTAHSDALEAYRVCSDASQENEQTYEDDYRFWRLDEQWPEAIKQARAKPGQERPMFTLNRGPTFARQVINDIRQNRPTVKFNPADSGADIETALVMTGIHRNINNLSRGDIARDTAAECAVYGGFGYYRIDIEYACDDTFDKDIRINRIVNPLSIKGDPYSTAADSLDWMMAFCIDVMTPEAFKDAYPKADPISFDMMDDKVKRDWTNGEDIIVAEYWKRAKAMKTVLLLSDGKVVDEEAYLTPGKDEPGLKDILDASGITPTQAREIETYVVDQCVLNGQEQLTEKIRWAGKYIPIVPVYGEEIHLKGKRMFWSMLHRARHAQEQFNYHETTATELYALSPRIPFIGEQGAFDVDPNWQTANTQNHPFLEYKSGKLPPQRQVLDSGPMLGAMSLSKQASDNLKAVLGMFDASLGNRSNENSGIAIQRRDQQSDVGNFHFTDNVSRAIACEGTIIGDLIPKVYTKGRIARVLGDDGTTQDVQLGPRQMAEQSMQPGQEPNPPKIGALQGVFDLSMGKYDVTVESGPSYTTQRQETAAVVGELIRANPEMMQIGGDIMVRNLDLKEGDELARRMKKMLPPQLQDNAEQAIPPQVQEQMAAMEQALQECQAELEKARGEAEQERSANLKGAGQMADAQTKQDSNALERERLALQRDRLPIDADQAKRDLLQKEIELLQARSTAAAQQIEATASAGEKNANAAVMTEFAAATQMLTQATAILSDAAMQIAAAAQANAVTNAAPKRKRMAIQKVNGQWVGDSVEVPAATAAAIGEM